MLPLLNEIPCLQQASVVHKSELENCQFIEQYKFYSDLLRVGLSGNNSEIQGFVETNVPEERLFKRNFESLITGFSEFGKLKEVDSSSLI